MTIISDSLEKTREIAKGFIEETLMASKITKTGKATVVALSGDLGSGKTAFVQAVAAILGAEDNVTSPTFVIEKIYGLPSVSKTSKKNIYQKVFSRLIHIDAYRLNSGKELTHLGWDEIVADPFNIIFIEWPERVYDIIPKNAIRLAFKLIDENTREIYGDNILK